MQNSGLDEAQAGINIAGRNSNDLIYANDTALTAESEEELDEGETRKWKNWLKTPHSKNEDHGIWSHHFMANTWGNNGNSDRLFLGSKITADGDYSHEMKEYMLLERKAMTNLDSKLKSRDITLSTKVFSQSYGFSCSHVWIWELDHKESWVLKNWCFQIVIMEKTLENPLDWKEVKLVNPKGNQSWIFYWKDWC